MQAAFPSQWADVDEPRRLPSRLHDVSGKRSSLAARHPRRFDIPLTAMVALVALAFGVVLPALEIESLFGDDAYSVLTGIRGFVESGNLLLAGLLLGFSVLFPAAKLVTLVWLWFAPMADDRRRGVLEWLELLGKWSLLDSFVIVVTIGTVQLGILSSAVARSGVYVYLGAILLSLVATLRLRRFAAPKAPPRPRLQRASLWLTVPAAGLYGIGLSLPLMHVEKGWFWENSYSLLDGTVALLQHGELVLGIAVLLFVIALPSLRFLGLLTLRLLQWRSGRWTRWLRLVDAWSMVEVFALALVVVFAKIGALADAAPRAGLWFLLAGGMLSAIDSVRFHLRTRAAGRS